MNSIIFQLSCSFITIGAIYLMGNKWRYAIIGVLSCIVWIAYATWSRQWGLQPLNIVSLVIYSRNSWLWLRRDK